MPHLCILVLKCVRGIQAHASASWQVCVYVRVFYPCFLKACISDYIRPKAARNSCHHVASASRRPHETDRDTTLQFSNCSRNQITRRVFVYECVCGQVGVYIRHYMGYNDFLHLCWFRWHTSGVLLFLKTVTQLCVHPCVCVYVCLSKEPIRFPQSSLQMWSNDTFGWQNSKPLIW